MGEKTSNRNNNQDCKYCHGCNAVYGLGFLGAIAFFISQATTFWMVVIGLLEAVVWPAFLVFELFKFLIK